MMLRRCLLLGSASRIAPIVAATHDFPQCVSATTMTIRARASTRTMGGISTRLADLRNYSRVSIFIPGAVLGLLDFDLAVEHVA